MLTRQDLKVQRRLVPPAGGSAVPQLSALELGGAKASRSPFDLEELRYLPLGIFLVSLPFAHTVALRLYMLLFALLIALADTARGKGPAYIPMKLPFALWTAMALASLAWSARPLYSLREIWNEIGYSLVAFLVCYTMVASERAWRLFLGSLVASFVAVSIVGLCWFAIGFDQVENAPHGGIGHYTTYLVTILPLLMVYALGATRYRFPANVLGPLLPLLVLVDGYATPNRAFWPAVIVSTVIFALLYAVHARFARFRMKALALAAMIVIIAITAFASSLQHRANVPARENVVEALADDPRLPLWAHVVTMIEQHPLTGGGFGRGVYGKELNDYFATSEIWHGHNMFLNYALQLGIGGVLVLVLLLGAVGREFWRLYRADDPAASLIGLAGIAMLTGFIAKNMTDDFFVRQNSLMFWSVVGLSLGYGRWRIGHASATTRPTSARDNPKSARGHGSGCG
jgi:O-antigen ligase